MSKNPSYLNIMNGGVKKDDHVDITSHLSDNKNNGGNDNMDKYVTHQELELSNEKLLHHIDNQFNEMDKRFNDRFNDMDKHFNKVELEINTVKSETKFANAKINWILGILSAVIAGGLVALITSLLK